MPLTQIVRMCRLNTISTPITSGMRTNIEIDDEHLAEAISATGATTKREAVEPGLAAQVKLKRQERIRQSRGKLSWDGDLEGCARIGDSRRFERLGRLHHRLLLHRREGAAAVLRQGLSEVGPARWPSLRTAFDEELTRQHVVSRALLPMSTGSRHLVQAVVRRLDADSCSPSGQASVAFPSAGCGETIRSPSRPPRKPLPRNARGAPAATPRACSGGRRRPRALPATAAARVAGAGVRRSDGRRAGGHEALLGERGPRANTTATSSGHGRSGRPDSRRDRSDPMREDRPPRHHGDGDATIRPST